MLHVFNQLRYLDSRNFRSISRPAFVCLLPLLLNTAKQINKNTKHANTPITK